VLEDVGAKENGAKTQASQEYFPTCPRLNFKANICELEDHELRKKD